MKLVLTVAASLFLLGCSTVGSVTDGVTGIVGGVIDDVSGVVTYTLDTTSEIVKDATPEKETHKE